MKLIEVRMAKSGRKVSINVDMIESISGEHYGTYGKWEYASQIKLNNGSYYQLATGYEDLINKLKQNVRHNQPTNSSNAL